MRSCARRSRGTPGSSRQTTPPGRTTRASSRTAARGVGDQLVVQHGHAQGGVEAAVGERQPRDLRRRECRRRTLLAVERQRERLDVDRRDAPVAREPAAGRTRPAAGVEQAPAGTEVRGQRLLEQRARRRVPPVRRLDLGDADVLVATHVLRRPSGVAAAQHDEVHPEQRRRRAASAPRGRRGRTASVRTDARSGARRPR